MYGEDAKRTSIVDSKYERVQRNFGQLSAKVSFENLISQNNIKAKPKTLLPTLLTLTLTANL